MQAGQKYDVGVIGLGYVGLTLAVALAKVGLKVCGVERRKDVVDLTNDGEPHFSETHLKDALTSVIQSGHLVATETLLPEDHCDVYVVTVGTPLDADGNARIDMIEAASAQVAENMRDGALVILRSTVKVGTTRDVVTPVLQRSGKTFDVAMCPERTLEGKAMKELRELPQIIGADTQEVRDRAGALFRNLTQTTVGVSSLEAAELVKLVDNTFRDVSFAFANEVARACEAFGVNALEVIESGKLAYPRTNVALPGLVGGPCLEKDPHILRQSVLTKGIDLEITAASRLVNERQPRETVEFIDAEMKRRNMPDDATVAMLGIAFKGVPATDDLRGAMSLAVLKALKEVRPHAKVRLYDPVTGADALQDAAPGTQVAPSVEACVEGAAVVLITNNHPVFGEQAPPLLTARMADGAFVYDYWNHFGRLSANERGDAYFAVGNTGNATGGAQ